MGEIKTILSVFVYGFAIAGGITETTLAELSAKPHNVGIYSFSRYGL
jgi:hypothetical protein